VSFVAPLLIHHR